jgi:N-acetyl-gamma-glutamyl-phosphate reductase
MIRTGIIEGAGFTGGELIRLLLNHPDVELVFITSRACAGRRIDEVHRGLYDETDLCFTVDPQLDKIDMLFLCTEGDQSREFMQTHELPEQLRVVDLSRAFRLPSDDALSSQFVYGLPELNRRATCASKYVANPGNFATGVLLGLLPLGRNLMLSGDIHVFSIVGSTGGTGESSSTLTDFNWRNDNISVYKPFVHPHLPEIEASLRQQQTSYNSQIHFVPCHGNFTRGIFTTILLKNKVSINQLEQLYEEYYERDSFTYLSTQPIDLKQVIHTNKCLIHLHKEGHRLLITTCIDNLLKGASGQAVHNMNLLFNLEETVGLSLKATAY